MKLPKQKHYEHPWYVQKLAHDFLLEDLWEFPILADTRKNHSLYLFRKAGLSPAMEGLQDGGSAQQGLTSVLFKLREWLGKIFGWDDKMNEAAIPGCGEKSLWERMSDKDRQRHQKDLCLSQESKAFTTFKTVYAFENETLQEISNQTVHALLHLAWVPKTEFEYTVQLAVYVKTRGGLGKIYMRLIQPFRHWIVYPALMKRVQHSWERSQL